MAGAWMVAASLLSWTAIAAAVDARTRGAALFGMLGPLVVAAASWMMAEGAWRRDPASLTSWMIAAFAGKTGIKVVASYAASSALMKQIEQGAPADVFASADLDWMDYAVGKKLVQDDTRLNLLGNELVLIAPKGSNIGNIATLEEAVAALNPTERRKGKTIIRVRP